MHTCLFFYHFDVLCNKPKHTRLKRMLFKKTIQYNFLIKLSFSSIGRCEWSLEKIVDEGILNNKMRKINRFTVNRY